MSWSKVLLSAYFGSVISIKATGWVGSGSFYRDIVRGERGTLANPPPHPTPPSSKFGSLEQK